MVKEYLRMRLGVGDIVAIGDLIKMGSLSNAL